MCIICDRNYDDNLIELNCYECKNIQEIPILPNLKTLYCPNTKMKYHPKNINSKLYLN